MDLEGTYLCTSIIIKTKISTVGKNRKYALAKR